MVTAYTFIRCKLGIIIFYKIILCNFDRLEIVERLLEKGYAKQETNGFEFYSIEKDFNMPDQKFVVKFYSLLIILLSLACDSDRSLKPESTISCDCRVERYDLFFKIDAAQNMFKSIQDVTISVEESGESITFLLHKDLVIDSIEIADDSGNGLPLLNREVTDEVRQSRPWGEDIYNKYNVIPSHGMVSGMKIILHIKYHMQPDKIEIESVPELLVTSISLGGSKAISPLSGIIPLFGGNTHAPFRMTLMYPEAQYACVPGERVEVKSESGFLIETYETNIAYIPVFSVAPYERFIYTKNNLTVEYFYNPGETFSTEMAENTLKTVELYTAYLTELESKTYRIAFVPLPYSTINGENKGNAIYLTSGEFINYGHSEMEKIQFTYLISHEIYHNWNIWSITWPGAYYQWFTEGGADFMAAWSCEKILNEKAGSIVRKGYVEQFIQDKAYNSQSTLENVQKLGSTEWTLMYKYGALAWEQLKLKIGEEAFFNGMRDFFQNYHRQIIGVEQLFACISAYTDVDIENYSNPWIKNNARIDLSITNVTVTQDDSQFNNEIIIHVESDQEYEIFTTVGYRTSATGDLTILEYHIAQSGQITFVFISDERPVYIQLDPKYQVPQMRLDNDVWTN